MVLHYSYVLTKEKRLNRILSVSFRKITEVKYNFFRIRSAILALINAINHYIGFRYHSSIMHTVLSEVLLEVEIPSQNA